MGFGSKGGFSAGATTVTTVGLGAPVLKVGADIKLTPSVTVTVTLT